jgi:hypothetical protein
MNAVEIEEAVSALAEQPFDAAEFPFAFLRAFGNKETTIKRLRAGNTNKSDVGGVLQRDNIHIAVANPGEVEATLRALRESPATAKAKARYILATDGIEIAAEDFENDELIRCEYARFPDYFGFFLTLAGITTVKQIRESSFDIRATGRLNKLYIELLKHNPEWATAARRADMNHFMARLIFCFFAEDTDIFRGEGLFTKTAERMSERDSSNTHEVIAELFRAMNTAGPDRKAANVHRWASEFPYVNGGLFSGSPETPRFTKLARSYLLAIGNLQWKQINPDIFGSMIQAVADDEERGALGMHYTSVPNILKVLNPLFLDDLRTKLGEAGDNSRKLLNLRNRMARIRVFDPACGSGNFLVIAYKEMRAIEAEINRRRGEADLRTEIPLTNFRGIELRDFAAEIARLALIIAEFQCDVLYRGQKEALAEFLPLDSQNWITCGNALRVDWLSVCPPTGTGVKLLGDDLFSTPLDQAEIDFENEGGETYICGNPPYKGSQAQTAGQKDDLRCVFETHQTRWPSLDYIAGWFFKAAMYLSVTAGEAAFVSTNSICQGEQVPLLWPLVFRMGYGINFCHTSFSWRNLATHNAGVTVVVIGFGADRSKKWICDGDEDGRAIVREVANISPYLVASDNAVVQAASTPLHGNWVMLKGNQPTDGGHLCLTREERDALTQTEPRAAAYVMRYVGSQEIIRGEERYCIWVEDDERSAAERLPILAQRFARVAEMRGASIAASTRAFASFSHRFRQIQAVGVANTIAIPSVSSERRPYLPVELFGERTIVSNLAFALYDAPLWNMALIASRLHLVWIATVCGKLKTDFRYSNTLGWNTFPVPDLTAKNKTDLTRCAEDILLAREAHFPATIADLYDPDAMPADLRAAHERNDEVLERIYIGRRFRNDTERLEKLFDMYVRMTAGPSARKTATRRGGAGAL